MKSYLPYLRHALVVVAGVLIWIGYSRDYGFETRGGFQPNAIAYVGYLLAFVWAVTQFLNRKT
jgi:hypothetical protein